MTSNETFILVLYYSQNGSTKALAKHIARGIEQAGITARLRTVPKVQTVINKADNSIPNEGDIFCNENDIANCSGLLLGSPTRFGNMAAPLKYFLDGTANAWMNGHLIGKPAGVFTSSSSMHGGQESTLLSMMLPLLHHGMVISGIPYSEQALHTTTTGGSPYGATHIEIDKSCALSEDEKTLCMQFGKRLAGLAQKLEQ